MKKVALFVMALAGMTAQAQTNLQVHYDFGEGREYVTTTLEMFKPDKWGNTFFFVDYNFNSTKYNHPSESYMEIARCLKFWDGPISAHIEYNGGLGVVKDFNFGYVINNAYLAGIDYGWNNADFSTTLNLKALYKNIAGKQHSVQFTGVWGHHFLDRKMSFTGFADFWLEDDAALNTSTVFIAEPQLWYNFTENFSFGTEIEIASNFAYQEGLKVCPTLGVKWNF